MSFATELRRRNVFKVGAAYAIVAWLLIQIADVVLPALQAPDWTVSFVTVLFILGFPIALLFAWAYEMTPEGFKAASDVSPAESITRATGQMLNVFIVGLLTLAVGFLIVDQYVLESPNVLSRPADSTTVAARPGALRRFALNLGPTEPISNTGLDAHLAFSPDGTRLAYAIARDGVTQLYIRALDQLEAREIPGTEGAVHPFFSPDSEWVGFYDDFFDAELKKTSVRGGAPQSLAGAVWASGAAWGTDEIIRFSTQDSSAERSLFSVGENGGMRASLLDSDDTYGYIWPDVLPGDEAALFTARPRGGEAGDGYIGLLDLESGDAERLIEGGYRPQYVPTGHIVFARAGALWAVPFDAGRREVVGREVPVLEGVQADRVIGGVAYTMSDDGTLAYLSGAEVSGRWHLRLVDRQGREELLSEESRNFNSARFSPDGQRVAMQITEGGNTDIWVYDLARSSASRLTFDVAFDAQPRWLPDGDHIVFSSSRDGHGLYVQLADGSTPAERLTSSAFRQRPESVSPDGEYLVYREDTPQGSDLHVLSLRGDRTSRPLLDSPFSESSAAISPDGRWIAYGSNETGRNEVFVRPFPDSTDGGKWQVSVNAPGISPRWGLEGRELFIVAQASSPGIVSVAVESGTTFSTGIPQELFSGAYVFNTLTDYDVSPDGQLFLLMREQIEEEAVDTQLIIVENWFEEVRRLAPRSG